MGSYNSKIQNDCCTPAVENTSKTAVSLREPIGDPVDTQFIQIFNEEIRPHLTTVNLRQNAAHSDIMESPTPNSPNCSIKTMEKISLSSLPEDESETSQTDQSQTQESEPIEEWNFPNGVFLLTPERNCESNLSSSCNEKAAGTKSHEADSYLSKLKQMYPFLCNSILHSLEDLNVPLKALTPSKNFIHDIMIENIEYYVPFIEEDNRFIPIVRYKGGAYLCQVESLNSTASRASSTDLRYVPYDDSSVEILDEDLPHETLEGSLREKHKDGYILKGYKRMKFIGLSTDEQH